MNRRHFLSALAASPLLAQQSPVDDTTARRLGKAGTKLLMVHADDAGMCHSVNLATSEALLSGSVQSASIMIPCPWVTEFAETARAHPELDLGLHLTLTSEWRYYRWGPVAPREKVKGLLDKDGYLFRDVRAVAMSATAEEVALELRAQIERARHLGIKFTHVDTHMGTLYARPDYFEVYTTVAKEAGVPCMLPRPAGIAREELKEYPITPDMLLKKEAAGYALLDRLVTGVPGRGIPDRSESYRKFLRDLPPGVTKLIVHLSKNDPEIRAISGAWEARWADFTFFTSTESKKLMAELGIKPVTYRELGNLKG